MSDQGFIYTFLPGVDPQVIDITTSTIGVDLIFEADDTPPASGLIVAKELLPNADHTLPPGVKDTANANSMASQLVAGSSANVPAINNIPAWLTKLFWTDFVLPQLPTLIAQNLLNTVLGPDNFTFSFSVGTPSVRARAVNDATAGNWLLLDFWIPALTLNVTFGSVINFPSVPTAPKLFDEGAGGDLGAGAYSYAITALDGNTDASGVQGETAIEGVATISLGAAGHRVTLSWPSVDNALGGYKVYRSRANDPSNAMFLITQVNPSGGTSVTFTDTLADGALDPDVVVSTTSPWMPKWWDPYDPIVSYNYLLWPSAPFAAGPTVVDGGRVGVLAPLFQGAYRYAITALAGDGLETAASPVSTISYPEPGHTTTLSWTPLPGADGGYNIYRCAANEGGNALFLVGRIAQPQGWTGHDVPTITFADDVSDDGLDRNTIPPTGSQFPPNWSPPSLGPFDHGRFTCSADLEFGLSLQLGAWPHAVAATWSNVLNASIQPHGYIHTDVDIAQALWDVYSAFVSLGDALSGGDWIPSGQSPGGAVQGATSAAAGFHFSQNPFDAVAAAFAQVQRVAATFGFLQCAAALTSEDSLKPLSLVMTHPSDPAPVAFDLSTMVGANQPRFSAFSLSTARDQATPASQLGVTGAGFPSLAQMGIGWTNTCSGFVTGSDVQWGALGEAPSVTHLPASAKFQFRPFSPPPLVPVPIPRRPARQPPAAVPYVFSVRNSDDDPTQPLTTTPFSAPVTVWPIGSVNLVLTYVSTSKTVPKPPSPATGVVVGVPNVASDGTFSASIIVPPDAAPGPATLCAQVWGETVICAPITIVGEIEPLIRLVDPTSLAARDMPYVAYSGIAAAAAGEGFTPGGQVSLYIDKAQGASIAPHHTVGPQGTFVIMFAWPNLTPTAHTLIAVEKVGGKTVQSSIQVTLEALT